MRNKPRDDQTIAFETDDGLFIAEYYNCESCENLCALNQMKVEATRAEFFEMAMQNHWYYVTEVNHDGGYINHERFKGAVCSDCYNKIMKGEL